MANKQMKKQESEITKSMLIGEVVSKHPNAVEVLFKHGIHCIGCPMTAYESIEQGCRAHGMSDEDIDEMLKEMNKADKGKKAKSSGKQ